MIDESLPWLEEALDIDAAGERLRACRAMSMESKVNDVRLVRHRAGRRCLIEYDIEDSEGGRISLVGKSRSKGLDRRTVSNLAVLARNGFGAGAREGIFVPAVRGVIEPWAMWLADKVPWQSAADALAGSCGTVVATRIGTVLHKLNQVDGAHVKRHTLDDELLLLDEYLSRASRARAHLRKRIESAGASCRRIAESLDERPPQCIHRDFYADQLLWNDGKLVLLDIDLLSAGDPRLDAGNFIAHVAEHSLRTARDSHSDRGLIDAFVDACTDSAEDKHGVAIYELLSFARHVWISIRIESRNQFTEQILAELERRLEDFQ